MENPDPSRYRYSYISGTKHAIRSPNGVQIYVDVYPVGFLLDFQTSWRSKSYRMHLKNLCYYAIYGNWRSIKNYFNGYLAEPDIFPGRLTRSGSGWTRKRALRDLKRRVKKKG